MFVACNDVYSLRIDGDIINFPESPFFSSIWHPIVRSGRLYYWLMFGGERKNAPPPMGICSHDGFRMDLFELNSFLFPGDTSKNALNATGFEICYLLTNNNELQKSFMVCPEIHLWWQSNNNNIHGTEAIIHFVSCAKP